jgi:hypothetical protein
MFTTYISKRRASQNAVLAGEIANKGQPGFQIGMNSARGL